MISPTRTLHILPGMLILLRNGNLALAILVFVLFGLAIGGGILMMIAGKPWLFILAMLAFLGTFAKYGCASQ